MGISNEEWHCIVTHCGSSWMRWKRLPLTATPKECEDEINTVLHGKYQSLQKYYPLDKILTLPTVSNQNNVRTESLCCVSQSMNGEGEKLILLYVYAFPLSKRAIC